MSDYDYDFDDTPTDFSFLGCVTTETKSTKASGKSCAKKVHETSTGIAYTIMYDAEWRAKLGASIRKFHQENPEVAREKGRRFAAWYTHSPEVRAIISEKVRKNRAEHGAPNKGRRVTEAERARMRETQARLRRFYDENPEVWRERNRKTLETRARRQAALSPETLLLKSRERRAKLSQVLTGRVLSPEHRAKLAEAARRRRTGVFWTPSGAFETKQAAAEWCQQQGLINAVPKINDWQKKFPKMFYYAKKESNETQLPRTICYTQWPSRA